MFSLGSGSVCDVCLESFGLDLKAPCSISCGHVFCADCLQHITRQSCPLCRIHFDPRLIVKLHVDLDSLKAASASAEDSKSAEEEARSLHERIAAVANRGTTEANLRALISECKTFLSNQPRNLFQDLRVSLRMIAYLCEVKSTLRSQNQAVDSYKEQLEGKQTEHEELSRRVLELDGARKEAVNARRKAEGERKDIQANAVQRELELTQKVSDMQNKYIDLLEQLNKQKALNDALREELHCLNGSFYSEQADYQRHSKSKPSLDSLRPSGETRADRSELRGLNVPEQEFMISPLPEFTSNALAADNFVGLPSEEDSMDNTGGCGAVDCPHSCDCSQFTPEEVPSNPPTVPVTPSLLSLTAPSFDSDHRASRSHSFSSRSAIPTRPASPVVRPIPDQLPHERNSLLRNHFHDLLSDTPASMASSLPNSVDYPSYDSSGSSPSQRSSPPRSIPSRSLESSFASMSPAPIPIPSVQPTTSITTAGSIPSHSNLPQRPALSRASSHAVAMENAQREKRKEHGAGDRRKSDKVERTRDHSREPGAEASSLLSESPIHQSTFPDSERARPPLPFSTKPESQARSPTTQSDPRDGERSSSNRYGSSESDRSMRESSRRSKNHIQVHELDFNSAAQVSSSVGRSSPLTPSSFKTGMPRPSRDSSSAYGVRGKVLPTTMTTASTSLAGFA